MEADEEDEEEMKLILFWILHKRRQDSRRWCYDEQFRRWQPEEYHMKKDEREHLVESPNRNARNK